SLQAPVQIALSVSPPRGGKITFSWIENNTHLAVNHNLQDAFGVPAFSKPVSDVFESLGRMQSYALDPTAIAQPRPVSSGPLITNGTGLAAVLDEIKDNFPERWTLLIEEMREWLPEYDYIQFEKPVDGQKGVMLRTKIGGHSIPARELSQGTLVALALLAL